MQLTLGDRAPDIVGATAAGRLFSFDAQAGRPALVLPLGGLPAERALQALRRLRAAAPALAEARVDAIPIAPPLEQLTDRLGSDPQAEDEVVYVGACGGLEAFTLDGQPAALLLDRSNRLVDWLALDGEADLAAWIGEVAHRIATEPARRCAAAAPVLIIPNVAPPVLCRALIDHFEASPHEPGVMASFANGVAYAKLDESKKLRRDLELGPGAALYPEIVAVLSRRVVPEIKRAFQVEITHADRVLIARYDDTGGYFRRHRDDAAPHTAFREFAISLNLNTHEYEGGELRFPEFDDHAYSPPAGAAIVFSASLLHEAAPVLKGSRYVLLSFLGSAAAQAKLDAWTATQTRAAGAAA